MKEDKIILRLPVESSYEQRTFALQSANDFMLSKPDRKAGAWNGTAYSSGLGWWSIVSWTPTGMVVAKIILTDTKEQNNLSSTKGK